MIWKTPRKGQRKKKGKQLFKCNFMGCNETSNKYICLQSKNKNCGLKSPRYS